MFTQVCFPHFAHFRRRPEKPASEELCYRLISHIDPLVCVGFLCCWTSCVAPHVCVLRTQLPTPSLNYSVWTTLRVVVVVFHLFVLPGSIGHAHFTRYCNVLYCIAHGSSSLSPCGLVLVAASSASAFLHLVSLECARLDVREFYDLYWINKPLVGGGGSLKSHQFATARDFLVV